MQRDWFEIGSYNKNVIYASKSFFGRKYKFNNLAFLG